MADQFCGPRRNQWPSKAFYCCYLVTNPFLPAGTVAKCTNNIFFANNPRMTSVHWGSVWFWMSQGFDTKLSSWCFMALSCLKALWQCGFSISHSEISGLATHSSPGRCVQSCISCRPGWCARFMWSVGDSGFADWVPWLVRSTPSVTSSNQATAVLWHYTVLTTCCC